MRGLAVTPSAGRLHSAGGLWQLPPWRRAPRLLLGIPVVFLAVVIAVAVLAVAAASGPLFLSSTRTAELHVQAAASCPEASLPGIANPTGHADDLVHTPLSPQNGAALAGGDAAVRGAARAAGVLAPYLVQLGGVAVPGVASAASNGVTLFSRPGALAHVRKLASAGGAGVWVPDDVARLHHLRPGQYLPVLGGQYLSTDVGRIRVAGIYRSLAKAGISASASLPRYWCTWESLIVPSLEYLPPPFLISDPGTLRAVAPDIDAHWYAPEPIGSMTVPAARAAVRATGTIPATLHREGLSRYAATTSLTGMLAQADRVQRGLRGSIVPIDLGGVVAALMLVAGAGVFWVIRRGRELRLLTSRGVGPAALAGKAVLEVAPAVLIGALVGWGGSIGLVTALGPASQLDAGAPWLALATIAVAVVAALLLIASVAVVATREAARHRSRRWARWVPWELALLAGAAGVYAAVRRTGATTTVLATVQINPWALAFPLLALSGAVLLLARLLRLMIPLLVRLTGRVGMAGYLAVRRIAGAPAVAIAVAVGVALPCGLLVYASSVTDTLSDNAHAKYQTYIGAEHALGTLTSHSARIDTDGHGTVVSVITADATIGDGRQVGVLGVQPASFARFAYQDGPINDLVHRLTATPAGHPVPALLVNAPAGTTVHRLTLRNSTLPVRVVARAPIFPGLRNGYRPLLVVNRAALRAADPFLSRTEEVWTTDQQLAACIHALAGHGIETRYQITQQTFLGGTGLLPVSWITGYLRALAILTGLVALTGLVFALAARVRRQTAAYILARRMGLDRRAHRRSLLIELTGVLGLGWLGGTGLAIATAALVYGLLDLDPADPPPPSLAVPIPTLAATAVVTAAALTVAAIATQRFADRARPATILRLE